MITKVKHNTVRIQWNYNKSNSYICRMNSLEMHKRHQFLFLGCRCSQSKTVVERFHRLKHQALPSSSEGFCIQADDLSPADASASAATAAEAAGAAGPATAAEV